MTTMVRGDGTDEGNYLEGLCESSSLAGTTYH